MGMLTTNRFNLIPVPATVVSPQTAVVVSTSTVNRSSRINYAAYRAITAPSRTPNNIVSNIHGYQRQPSMPEIRPFSEDRKQKSLTSQYRVRERRKRKDSDNIPYYKDRTYLSHLYSWAKADQEKSDEAIKGLDLAHGILHYKPMDNNETQINGRSTNEISIRPGMGYSGYMDCLLRGRRKNINKKVTKEAAKKEAAEAASEPTLVPSNSLVKEK